MHISILSISGLQYLLFLWMIIFMGLVFDVHFVLLSLTSLRMFADTYVFKLINAQAKSPKNMAAVDL